MVYILSMKKTTLVLITFLIISVCSIDVAAPRARNFFLFNVDGNPVILDSLLSTGPVVICMWALWCKMSIKEIDALNVYYEEFRDMGLHVLAISQDRERSIPYVKPFVIEHGWRYSVVLDPDNIIRELYNVQAIPTTYIIEQDGSIVVTHLGYKPGDEVTIVDTLRYLFGD